MVSGRHCPWARAPLCLLQGAVGPSSSAAPAAVGGRTSSHRSSQAMKAFAGLQGGWVPSAVPMPNDLLSADMSSAHLLPCWQEKRLLHSLAATAGGFCPSEENN